MPPAEYTGSSGGPSIEAVQAQVNGVRVVMQENVDVMLANIDKTEVLENKSSQLATQAKSFQKSSRKVKKHMCRQNAKMNLLIAAVCVIVLLAILIPVISSASSAAAATGSGSDPGNDSRRRLASLLFSEPLVHLN
jgi:vesicle-associated membrane protein 8